MTMKKKPDIAEFLEGGAADAAARKTPEKEITSGIKPTAKVHREQKIFRLPLDLINDLKKEAYERTMMSGERVTETELVEQALRAFFKKKIR